MIYVILKIINTYTRIYALNLKYDIKKETLTKFVNNVSGLIDDFYLY